MNFAVTNVINSYHVFDRQFWLSYKSLEKVMPKEEWDKIKMNLLKAKKVNKKYIQPYQELYLIECLLLDLEWKNKAELDKQNGTLMHEAIHLMFCNLDKCVNIFFQIPIDEYKFSKTEEFLNTDKGIFSEFRMEIPLEDNFILVGIADLIKKDGNDIYIYDWKNVDKIEFKSRYDFGLFKTKMMKHPLNKLMDANGIHYLLLLSMYAWMLLKMNPDFNIKELNIVLIKDFKPKKTYLVEYLKDGVEKLLKWHVKHTKLKEEMKLCNLIEY